MSDIINSRNNDINSTLENLKEKYGFLEAGISSISKPITIEFYKKWLAEGAFGSMNYLADHFPAKENPKLLNENLNSAISVSASYLTPSRNNFDKIPARTALYAQSDDYHYWVKHKLQAAIVDLQSLYPQEIFLPYVDSGPILERDWGYKNRLGWFGKNTCLIHPKHGSLFFIAEIMTSLKINSDETLQPLPDFCGTCDRCIKSCPTQAIKSPRQLKADECISYLTIESKKSPPLELRFKMQDWFFGCDICQTVCPWNEKIFKKNELSGSSYNSSDKLNIDASSRKELVEYFQFLFTNSNRSIFRRHKGSPLLRAGARGLRRNAMIVTANQNLYELKQTLIDFTDPALEELKNWTLQQLKEN